MTRCINKACQGSSYIANYVEHPTNGTKLDMYIQQQRSNGGSKKSYYYFITKNGSAAPTRPSARNATAWEADAVACNSSRLLPPATRRRPDLLVDAVVVSANPQHNKSTRDKRQPPDEAGAGGTTKRSRRGHHGGLLNGGSSIAPPSSCDDDDATSSPDNDDAILASSPSEVEPHQEAALDIDEEHTAEGSHQDGEDDIHHRSQHSYWDSPEAKKLFRPLASESTVVAAIDNQINILRLVNKSANACIDIIAGSAEERNEDDITQHQKWVVQQKAQYLALSLHLAKEKMNAWTWEKCCEHAVNQLERQGITHATHYKTVCKWYRSFRETRRFHVTQMKRNLPPFLHENPEICTAIKEYARTNLDTLSIEMLSEFIHDKVLPNLVKDLLNETEKSVRAMMSTKTEEYNTHLRNILKPYGLACVSPSAVYRWMIRLGFRYEPARKGYYVDGHERPATIQYRWDFCRRYLAYEKRMHRWVQVPEAVAQQLEKDEMIARGSGYKYLLNGLTPMREFHVDSFDPKKSKEFLRQFVTTNFGGNLSVRMDPSSKPLISLGHDECIFKQYPTPTKQWYGPNGETFLRPKDDGLGVMASAFQSREFGFGLDVTEADLGEVNRRRHGVRYRDTQAAQDTRRSEFKPPLTTSPFVREFEFGQNNDGYWSYQHMVLELEDCVDVLNVKYPQYDFLFLFDHSCGHDRQREDGLNVEKMSKSFGGRAQRKMRETKIKQSQGYLGPHSPKLQVGDTQSMVFSATDSGPFWMTAVQRADTRYDQVLDEPITREFTKDELVRALKERHVSAKGKKAAIQKIAQDHGLPLHETKTKVIEGWEGKPKGLLQILWERGIVDESRLSEYTMNGRQNGYGIVDKTFALKSLMANCLDFEEEETLLQSMGREMGVLVDRTPKCHCEMAGEGIEYSWGCAKNSFRRVPLKLRRGKENFRNEVRSCLSREKVLVTERIRLFSRRARSYICAYYVIWCKRRGKEGDAEMNESAFMTDPVKMEKMIRHFKTHRCALDFDHSFCNATFIDLTNED